MNPPATEPEAAAPRPAGRTHRGRGRGRRGTVSVVLPAEPEAATQEAAATAALLDASHGEQPPSDTALSGVAAPEIVPGAEIRAEEAAAQAAPTSGTPETAAMGPGMPTAERAPAGAEAAAQPEMPIPAASARRYRFERRTPAALHRPPAMARPERLSGRLTPSAPVTFPELGEREHAEAVQPAAAAPAPVAGAISEVVAPAPATPGAEISALEEVAMEPAAEADEEGHEAAGRRRRRRRRARTGPEEGESLAHGEQPEVAAAPAHPAANGFEPAYPPAELEEGYPSYAPYVPGSREQIARQRPPEAPWSISQAQQQISQPTSPFGAPEPSFARGFGPQPRGVAQPYHEALTRPARPEREMPPISTNQLAQVIGAAITHQTDRLISELRRQVATPPAITVAMPPTQSTERVGVFVDVANLLYSARNMRMSIDFGRLLDFLRGNRRLIRAHAYAPTSPEPNAEQAFLSVVKGVGYRITTKNYKTFASGAKKADLDLDMCMDIVRLVDAGAIDTLVLVSGDSDFLPVLEWCSDRGLRIEVAAFEDAVSAILRQSCDLFINLSLVPDIRA